MVLAEERKAALLAYCRIDELTPEDESLLETMFLSAVDYMAGAGVSAPKPGTPRAAQYDLCVNALVLDDWDHRGASDSKSGTYTITENRSFRRRLNQLKIRALGDVSESDTPPSEEG